MKRNWLILFVMLAAFAGCTNRNYSSGDRVLVSKYLYEAGVRSPERFDVVVFKWPEHPVQNNVPRNYIKRLLGLPGEILAIFFGRIFKWAPEPGQAPPFPTEPRPGDRKEDLWNAHYMFANNNQKALDLFNAGAFEIVRKPPQVQLAMRRIVYDHDFQPKDLKGILPSRWTPKAGSAWSAVEKSLTHSGLAKKDTIDWIRYQHVLRPLPTHEGREEPLIGGRKAEPELITDLMGYNTSYHPHSQSLRDLSRGKLWVGDLMLDCQVEVTRSQGEFWMELSKGIHRFQACFHLESGNCNLFRLDLDGKRTPMGEAETKLKAPGKYRVRFANIDARLTIWVDSALPFGDGMAYDPPEIRRPNEKDLDEEALKKRRGPEPKNDLEPASLGSQGAAISVHHLQLWRDTYYHGDQRGPLTLYVQPGHYLVLGDNSPQSSDSRTWGLVPERLLLGRALLVYYPFNRAGMIR